MPGNQSGGDDGEDAGDRRRGEHRGGRIHAVAIDAGRLQRNFLQALIAASDGLFVEIDP